MATNVETIGTNANGKAKKVVRNDKPATKGKVETAEEKIARLEAENARLKEANAAGFRLKVSEKGALSIYGTGSRFPVTLYLGQWEMIMAHKEEIDTFIEENRESFKTKGEKE